MSVIAATPLGVKTPVAETPVPDQVPPAGENPASVYALGVLHTPTSNPAFTIGIGLTVIAPTSVAVQELASVTVTV